MGRRTTFITVAAVAMAIAAPTALRAQSDEITMPPNVIVVVSDDQVKGTEDAMPVLQAEIIAKGITFDTGITPTALCCPSRASLLTGNQAHTTGVYTIENGPRGGWKAFHERGAEADTLATRLDALGYTTGLFGKYLNGFQAAAPEGYVPPGWDTFRAIQPDDGTDGSYYKYSITGLTDHFGTAAVDYSTDVLGQMAADFVAAVPPDQPFFVMYTPYGPHLPLNPAPRHKNVWPVENASSIPAYNEADVSDKPAWVQAKPLLTTTAQVNNLRRQHNAVMSIDDQIQNIIDAAGDRILNTVLIYMSDNGFMLGSHRLTAKDVPYQMATEVPMYARWDGHIDPATTTSRVTPQIDLTALIADATGIASWQMEGRNPLTTDRDGVALEQVRRSGHPAYCGWRSEDHLYVKYSGRAGSEFYDYVADPQELTNVVKDSGYTTLVEDHRLQAVANCYPTPYGFTW